jgi:TorA maturation chaperone TorD
MRANLYLLGAALFEAPRRENHEALRALMWRVIYRSPPDADWVPPLLEIADAHEREESLQRDYLRLFDASGAQPGAAPYGSFWLEPAHEPMGRTTMDVSKLMSRYGMGLDRHAGMLPDHLVAELELMANLAARERTENTRDAQEHLMLDHLGVWVPRFLTALRDSYPPRFYRMAAHYLEAIIAWDSRRLGRARDPIAA